MHWLYEVGLGRRSLSAFSVFVAVPVKKIAFVSQNPSWPIFRHHSGLIYGKTEIYKVQEVYPCGLSGPIYGTDSTLSPTFGTDLFGAHSLLPMGYSEKYPSKKST